MKSAERSDAPRRTAQSIADQRQKRDDDVLSIEHEDVTMTPLEGVRRSVELLKRVIPS